MFDMFGKRFFSALHESAETKLGADHPCAQAAGEAARTGSKADAEAAQEELSILPADVSDALMEAVHKTLREDPSALLDLWQGVDGPDRPQ